jgi:hypothetical protein
MSLTLTAHQVGYIPGLRLLHKIAKSDLFCSFDIVPMGGSDGWESRNKIKTQNGEQWLTVPCKRDLVTPIHQVRIVDGSWRRKHQRAIQLAYSKAPFYNNYAPFIMDTLSMQWNMLHNLNLVFLLYMLDKFEIKKPFTEAHRHDFQGTKSELVLDMCKKLGANAYIFGENGRNYADVAAFNAAGITVEFQDYQYPTYNQLHGPFISNMSALDLLFNHGPESRKILMGE